MRRDVDEPIIIAQHTNVALYNATCHIPHGMAAGALQDDVVVNTSSYRAIPELCPFPREENT